MRARRRWRGGRRDDIGESRIARIRREPRAETRGVEVTRDAMRLTMRASRDGRVLCVDEVFTNESGDRARVPGEYGCV